MRPRKKILLVGPLVDPATASLKFVLDCKGLAVTHTVLISEAQQLLSERCGQFSLLLIIWPRWGDMPMLDAARAADPLCPILAVASKATSTPASHTLVRPTMTEMMDCIKVMITRKRGPRKGSPSAMRCGVPAKTSSECVA